MSMINLDRLALFVATVDLGTVSAAANEVHLSQPAASRALSALEQDLDTRLFDRVGRGLVLNAAGRALLPRARALLRQAEETRSSIEVAVERGYHDVRIGTVDSIGTYVMPTVLPQLRSRFDGLGVRLITRRTTDVIAGLRADLDLGVIAWSGVPPVPGALRVARYDLQFWGRADRFGALAGVTTESELSAFPLVQLEAGPGQPSLVDPGAPSYALVQSLACVKALVVGGFGVGALLNYMVDSAERRELVRAAVPHDPDCGLWVVRSERFVGARAEEIQEALSEAVCAHVQADE